MAGERPTPGGPGPGEPFGQQPPGAGAPPPPPYGGNPSFPSDPPGPSAPPPPAAGAPPSFGGTPSAPPSWPGGSTPPPPYPTGAATPPPSGPGQQWPTPPGGPSAPPGWTPGYPPTQPARRGLPGWAKAAIPIVAVLVLAGIGILLFGSRSAATDLKLGDCFDGGQGATVSEVASKRCDEPHDAEVYAVIPVRSPGDTFPGTGFVRQQGTEDCAQQAQQAARPDAPELVFNTLFPTEETWRRGDRTIVCFFTRPGGEKLTQSVRVG